MLIDCVNYSINIIKIKQFMILSMRRKKIILAVSLTIIFILVFLAMIGAMKIMYGSQLTSNDNFWFGLDRKLLLSSFFTAFICTFPNYFLIPRLLNFK